MVSSKFFSVSANTVLCRRGTGNQLLLANMLYASLHHTSRGCAQGPGWQDKQCTGTGSERLSPSALEAPGQLGLHPSMEPEPPGTSSSMPSPGPPPSPLTGGCRQLQTVTFSAWQKTPSDSHDPWCVYKVNVQNTHPRSGWRSQGRPPCGQPDSSAILVSEDPAPRSQRPTQWWKASYKQR